MDLYIPGSSASGGSKDAAAVETQLWHVWDVLMGILKDHRMHYLEAKSWLVNTLARTTRLSPAVRLAALTPFMQFSSQPGSIPATEHQGRSSSRGRSRSRGRKRSCSMSRGRCRRRSRSRSEGKGVSGHTSPPRARSRSWDVSPERRARSCRSPSSSRRSRRDSRSRSRSRSRRQSHESRSRSRSASGGRSRRDTHRGRSPVPQPMATHIEQVTVTQQLQHQLLLLLLEEAPIAACGLLAQLPHIFRSFFAASDLRIMLWFSHFSVNGMGAFKYGAFALAHYCLAHRDEAWAHLVWEGKHPQAPVSVATKTHYFCEVNVVASVRNLLERCPGFWSSEQWIKCVTQGGEVLQLEPAYFAKALHGILAGAEGPRLQAAARTLLHDFVARDGPWGPIVHRLLPLLDEDELLTACMVLFSGTSLEAVPSASSSRSKGHSNSKGTSNCSSTAPTTLTEVAGPQGWRDISGLVMAGGVRWVSLPQLVLAHSLVCTRQQLLGMLQEDEDCSAAVEQLYTAALALHSMPPTSINSQAHAALISSLRNPRTSVSARQLLALDMWTLRLALATRALGERHDRAASAGNDLPAAAVDGVQGASGIALLQATVERLGGACSVPAAGAGAAGAQVPGVSRDYALLDSDDEREGRRERKGKHKRNRRKSKHSKKGKHKKHRRHSSSSASTSDSNGDSETDRGGSADHGVPAPAPKGSHMPGAATDEQAQHEAQEAAEGAGDALSGLPGPGLLYAASSQLQQLEVTLGGAQNSNSHKARPTGLPCPVLSFTGRVADVADVLACFACKQWVQAALQGHTDGIGPGSKR